MDKDSTVVEALAIRGGKIIELGTSDAIQKKFVARKSEDLQGHAVFPGFIDAHLHVLGVGRSLQRLNFIGTNSYDEILNQVETKIKSVPNGRWIFGRGWDQNDWPVKEFPTNEMLNKISPNHFIYLTRVDGHAVLVNQKVLDLARITSRTADPPGGKIIRGRNGLPSGVFVDNAITLVSAYIPEPTASEDSLSLALAMDAFAKFGLTSVHDAGVDSSTVALYKSFGKAEKLITRIYAMLSSTSPSLLNSYFQKGPEKDLYNGFLTISSVKIYADGALGSRGAALLEPYSDSPDNVGLDVTPKHVIESISENALRHGFQVCTHAIGDRGNRNALDAYEEALTKTHSDGKAKRLRIEHAQVINEFDLPRFARLGVIASMQPTHCTSDMYWAITRLGDKRLKGAYAWQELIGSGATICNGSDAPVESANPLWGIYAAVTRQDQTGFPEGGWYPDQRMTMTQALRGFTLSGAYAAFEEDFKGTLEKNRAADLVVLSKDLMTIESKDILKTEVLKTMVGGHWVYRK